MCITPNKSLPSITHKQAKLETRGVTVSNWVDPWCTSLSLTHTVGHAFNSHTPFTPIKAISSYINHCRAVLNNLLFLCICSNFSQVLIEWECLLIFRMTKIYFCLLISPGCELDHSPIGRTKDAVTSFACLATQNLDLPLPLHQPLKTSKLFTYFLRKALTYKNLQWYFIGSSPGLFEMYIFATVRAEQHLILGAHFKEYNEAAFYFQHWNKKIVLKQSIK